jgi:hypothetical protein
MSNFLINSFQFGNGKYTITLPELDVLIDTDASVIDTDHFNFLTSMDMPNEDGMTMMMVIDFKNILELINSTASEEHIDIVSVVERMVAESEHHKIRFTFDNREQDHIFILDIDPSIDVHSLFESSAIVQVDSVDIANSSVHISLMNFHKYNHSHSASYTPAGTIDTPTFTGEETTYTSTPGSSVIDVRYTPPSLRGGSFPTIIPTSEAVDVIGSMKEKEFINQIDVSGTSIGVVGYRQTDSRRLNISIASGLYHGKNSCFYVTTSVTPSIDVASLVSSQNKKFLTSAALSRGSFPTLAAGGITVITGSHRHDTTITPSGTISTPTFTGTTATITVS